MLHRRAWVTGAFGTAVIATAAWFWWPANAPELTTRVQHLSDGVEVFSRSDSRLTPAAGYPTPREIRLDGDFFIRVPQGPTPLIVRSRLLVLTVSSGSAFRITAYAREAGEQVEVLEGHIVALKSYPSNYMEPDQLGAGDMTMINRDIDLMEKEHADLEKLRAWSEALVASAGHRAPR